MTGYAHAQCAQKKEGVSRKVALVLFSANLTVYHHAVIRML